MPEPITLIVSFIAGALVTHVVWNAAAAIAHRKDRT